MDPKARAEIAARLVPHIHYAVGVVPGLDRLAHHATLAERQQ